MKRLLDKSERLADTASLFAANIAAAILLALVVLTCVDVIGRYFLTMPVTGAVELVRICMAGIIFFSMPLMFFRNDHIIVDLIGFFRKGYMGWIIGLVLLIVSFLIAIKLGDRVFDYAIRALEDGDTTEYLGIPRYIVVGLITASIFTSAFLTLLRFAITLTRPGDTVGLDGNPPQ
ncbi:TRAP transporter small permease [Granulosicoccus sp.]|jgi:TRAP-type C4-dicarboxylate transport system permease small subunit|nr:TRAP transporter small permease [Granulosicoccus sp.]MDB4222178.1 TRAP transporter small permease [Granulosicoccus sp.]